MKNLKIKGCKNLATIVEHSQELQEVSSQYSKISRHYEYWFKSSWPEPAYVQGAALERVIASQGLTGKLRVLDLTAGVGTQAIGMALRGHDVTALDISEGQVARGQAEAMKLSPDMPLHYVLGDATNPQDYVDQTPYDVIFSFGNSLPLLGSIDALRKSMAGSYGLIKDGGLVIISMRDHSHLRSCQPHFIGSGPVDIDGKKGVWVETAEWLPEGDRYKSHITFVLTSPAHEEYYYPFPPLAAVTKDEFLAVLQSVGFNQPIFYEKQEYPEFTCPLFIGKK